jgi:4-hydroxy-2-oxoheptanedioate aldolase
MFRPNPFKAALAAGIPQLGIWLVANNNVTAEIAGRVGYDFAIIDHEHGPGDLMGAIGQLQALRASSPAGGPASFIRVAWNDPVLIKRALDTGVEGVMIPMVETAEQARAAVSACLYPPAGTRGCALGAMRATGFGADTPAYWEGINREVCVMLQIETEQAVDNIPEIAAVDGVDILFIGPNDLLVSAGYDPLAPEPAAKALIERAEAAILKAGKPMGAVPHSGLDLDVLFDRGYAMIGASSELSLLRRAALAQVEAHRPRKG